MGFPSGLIAWERIKEGVQMVGCQCGGICDGGGVLVCAYFFWYNWKKSKLHIFFIIEKRVKCGLHLLTPSVLYHK